MPRRLHAASALALLMCASSVVWARAAPQLSPPAITSTFLLFLRSVQIGSEEVSVTRTAEGWTIASGGRIGPPIDLVTKSLQLRYQADWKPLELTIDATVRGQALGMHVTTSGTTATTHINNAGQPTDRIDTIAPDAALLPNPFFAAYEAISRRLTTAPSGTAIAVYQGGPVPIALRVGNTDNERIQTVGALIEARRTYATLIAENAETPIEIWADSTGRLLRMSVPGQGLEFVRDDVASVSTRRVAISRTGDEQVQVPANGFNLAGTLSKPAGAAGKRPPAIILVAGSGPVDRDETVVGIPILGQLAAALADAGFTVLRYDKRGVGQSGGRIETAGLSDYADDLAAAVKFLASRKDVDSKRIVVVGHSEGGSVALIEAARTGRVAALVLLGAAGVSGSDLVLAQQRHVLDRSNLPEADKQTRIELQKKIHQAVMTGKGWDAVPADLRRQADNAEFQSILVFDPAAVMPRVRQPILIVHGALDMQVDPSNADRLESLARSRKHQAPVETVKIPGVNHLFVPATTGEVAEYASLKDKQITPNLAPAIAEWARKVLPPPR
jgi:pimeloyl-ACP methyl ester carboxylesterase